jgi:type I restriction enzyme S subunit
MNHKTGIPQMRFPGFEGNWELKKLGSLSNLITKGTTPKKFVEEGIKFIKLECFDGDRINPDKCLFIDEKTHNKELKRSILKEGDILFAIAGATIGKVNIVTNEILPANTNQALSIVRLKVTDNSAFIYHNLKSHKIRRYILDNISVGAQPNLNLEQMNNFAFYLPTLSEQQKIASFLGAVDEKIQQLSRKKELLAQYKKGLMQQLFSGKLRFKDVNGKDYLDWEEKKLGELAKITTGKLDANAMVQDGEYRFYTCAKDYYRIDKFAFDTEALLISGNGANVGYIHYYKGKFNAYQRTYVLDRIKEDIFYLKFYLDNFLYERIYTEKKEGNTPYIVISTLSDMEILLPSLPEQQKIAAFLSSIDGKIESTNQQINQTQSFKKGLLQQLFV